MVEGLKEALDLIAKAKDYAKDSLGFSIDGFEEYKDDDKEYFFVYSAKKDSLESIIQSSNSRPHKFFKEEDEAEKLAAKMEEQGYDIHIFRANACSLKPKITKGFLKSNIARKVGLLFHESVHQFLNANKDVLPNIPFDLNEALATYLGKKGSYLFCKDHFPNQVGSAEYHIKSWRGFVGVVNNYYKMLQIVYRSKELDSGSVFDAVHSELGMVNYKFERHEINNAFFIRNIDYTKVFPVVEAYFDDKRRTIKGLFSARNDRLIGKFRYLIRLREEYLKDKD